MTEMQKLLNDWKDNVQKRDAEVRDEPPRGVEQHIALLRADLNMVFFYVNKLLEAAAKEGEQ